MKKALLKSIEYLISHSFTKKDKEVMRVNIVEAVVSVGELSLLDLALEVGRRAKSRKEERPVTPAEFLAEVVNHQLMSGNAEGKEFGRCMNEKHNASQRL